MIQDPGIEPADPQVIALWEQDLQSRLQQAYPRMCYYFLCDKSLFVLVTLLTIRRIDKADALRGESVPSRRADRQYVDEIAQCMSDAELRFDKDEEWMTWWRETLLTVQQGLHRGWIGADSPVRINTHPGMEPGKLKAARTEHCLRQGHNEVVSKVFQNSQAVG